MGPNSWLGYQQVTISDYDDEKNPLSMEGFGQAISLFVVREMLYCRFAVIDDDDSTWTAPYAVLVNA